jgi:hypothetical protein
MINPQQLNDRLYGGTVTERRELASALFEQYGQELRNDNNISELLSMMRQCVKELNHHMKVMDLGGVCVNCAKGPDGGCCSAFMAGETDVLQILMNMLADVKVIVEKRSVSECCYLGPLGCVFEYKPMFCLNYNCSEILELDSKHIKRLDTLTGQLLRQQHILENALARFFSKVLMDES